MMWWFGYVFIDRNNPEKIALAPEYDTADKRKENSVMLKIKLSFAFLRDKYENYIDLRETRRALKPLDDHILKDIGLSPADLHALMTGQAVVRQQVLTKLSKRRLPIQKALSSVGVLPEGLSGIEQNAVTNPERAANDCEACAA